MKMPTTTRLTLALLLAGATLPALAQTTPPAGARTEERRARMEQALNQRFNQADSNHDGLLQMAEAQAGMPKVAQNFAAIDTEGQGAVTLDQIKAYMVQRIAEKHAAR